MYIGTNIVVYEGQEELRQYYIYYNTSTFCSQIVRFTFLALFWFYNSTTSKHPEILSTVVTWSINIAVVIIGHKIDVDYMKQNSQNFGHLQKVTFCVIPYTTTSNYVAHPIHYSRQHEVCIAHITTFAPQQLPPPTLIGNDFFSMYFLFDSKSIRNILIW